MGEKILLFHAGAEGSVIKRSFRPLGPASSLDDPDLDGGGDPAAQLHRDLGQAQCLDRLVEVDLLASTVTLLLGQSASAMSRR